MVALFSLLVVVAISIIVVRIGAVALTMTGLSEDIASFQALSAFSGTGFTTNEAESVVAHATRRRIAKVLMLLGNAGLTSGIATLVLTFASTTGHGVLLRMAGMVAGLLILWRLTRSRAFNRFLNRLITRALEKWTTLRLRDYAHLLQVERGYTISQITVNPGDWLSNKTLAELALNREGILVLGVRRQDGAYYGATTGDFQVRPGDVLTCYGREELLEQLAIRLPGSQGDAEHAEAMRMQDETIRRQREQLEETSGRGDTP